MSQNPEDPFILAMAGQLVVVPPVSDIETIRTLPETDVSIKYVRYKPKYVLQLIFVPDIITTTCSSANTATWAPRPTNSMLVCATL
jgi:hypothetical protein